MRFLFFEVVAGRGVVADLGEKGRVIVGSNRPMEGYNNKVSRVDGKADRMRKSGETLLYTALNEELVGLIGVLDHNYLYSMGVNALSGPSVLSPP